MAADAVYDAIVAFLSDSSNVAGLADPTTLVVPIIRFENPENFATPTAVADGSPTPWIGMALVGVLYGQQSLGASTQAANRWDETGSLWLSVFVPKGSGGSRARQLAKLIADLFRGLTLLNDSLEFMDAFIGQGGPAPEEGNWYELPVIIDYRRIDA